jgi:hypothetical protein
MIGLTLGLLAQTKSRPQKIGSRELGTLGSDHDITGEDERAPPEVNMESGLPANMASAPSNPSPPVFRVKRYKVPRACDACRLRKLKCDGIRPGWCLDTASR